MQVKGKWLLVKQCKSEKERNSYRIVYDINYNISLIENFYIQIPYNLSFLLYTIVYNYIILYCIKYLRGRNAT